MWASVFLNLEALILDGMCISLYQGGLWGAARIARLLSPLLPIQIRYRHQEEQHDLRGDRKGMPWQMGCDGSGAWHKVSAAQMLAFCSPVPGQSPWDVHHSWAIISVSPSVLLQKEIKTGWHQNSSCRHILFFSYQPYTTSWFYLILTWFCGSS